MHKEHKKNLDHRLAIAVGHLQKVRDMVAKDAYCIDVLQQSLAVQSALKRVDELVLEHHLQTCVSEAMKNGKKDIAISEVIEVFKKGRG